MEDSRIPRLREDAGEAVYTPSAVRSVPGRSEESTAGYAALHEGAALVRLPGIVLRLSGDKTVELLNSVLTNQVPEEGNRGVYALLLNPKGRIQTDLRVLRAAGGALISTEPEGAAAAKELLGRYAPFYRVEVEDLFEADAAWRILGLYGPRSGDLLDDLELGEHESAEVSLNEAALRAAGVAVPVPGYDLLGPEDALDAARSCLLERGAVPASLDAYEAARVAAGVPRFGSDITPENFPAEAGILERAVSFEKGCYPGQETVARMYYRGHPNRMLRRFAVEGAPPFPGTEIFQGEKKVGYLTSVAPVAVDGKILVLGYLHRNVDPRGRLVAGEALLNRLS